MPEDLIRYDVLAQEALRGVIRKVLQEVAKTGLPGEHHFFIAFDTQAPGVQISPRLKSEYPEEMTVVLQHQFWDLDVGEKGFSVGLSFNGIPEKLSVPFAAVKGFFDPSVQFGLQFDVVAEDEREDTAATGDNDLADAAETALAAIADSGDRKSPHAGTEAGKGAADRRTADKRTADKRTADKRTADKRTADGGAAEREKAADQADAASAGNGNDESPAGADVVSLDSFRKKT